MIREDTIRNAPDFSQEQIEFLERCVTTICIIDVGFGIEHMTIRMLREEMFRRGLIKKDYKKLFWGEK